MAESPNYYLRITAGGESHCCEVCNRPRSPGDWPWCPHGSPRNFGFDPFTPYVDPNILPWTDPRAQHEVFSPIFRRKIKGTLITSREQRKAIMKEQGLDWAPRTHESGGREV
jgi:hypothetical protein